MQSKSHKLLATLTMLFAIGLFAVMSPAQDQSSQPQENQQPSQAQSNQVTATGCLQKSGSNAYSLTDQATNQSYTLTSSTVDLSAHVGHMVKVTGTQAAASAANPSPSGQPSGQAAQGQSLDVSSLQMVSDSCSSGGGSSNPPQRR